MPISLDALAKSLNPKRTVLLLGAGASVPSGAPSGMDLAKQLWKNVALSEPMSEDLIETSTILERRHGRRAVVDYISLALGKIKPSGGILGIPSFDWSSIFSTNFDKLIEKSYKLSGKTIDTIRSNYDMTAKESRHDISYYKVHGCITQDRSLGHQGSMILTEGDYEEFEKYRQAIFSTLNASMHSNDVLIIGQSLSDPHLQSMIKRVLSYKDQGISSRIYLLVFNHDDLRAPLWEDRGAVVAFGGIDQLVHALAHAGQAAPLETKSAQLGLSLPASVVGAVDIVSSIMQAPSNILKMFNGGPATYPDIKSGSTFERSRFNEARERLLDATTPVVAIVGAAGVGKTTFGRQLVASLSDGGWDAYEFKKDFPFQSEPWISLEGNFASSGKRALILIDECTRSLRQVNLLIDRLSSKRTPALKVVLTANAAQWTPRLKTPNLFKRGLVIELSRLEMPELNSLINLYNSNSKVSELVSKEFRSLNRRSQLDRLREKCGADMFVCLNNIFANDSLDTILL